MDSILTLLIIGLLIGNFIAVILLLKRKQPDQVDNSQILKDEVSSCLLYTSPSPRDSR